MKKHTTPTPAEQQSDRQKKLEVRVSKTPAVKTGVQAGSPGGLLGKL